MNGALATTKSQNGRVLAFAKQMIGDHESVESQTRTLVTKLNLAPQASALSRALLDQADVARDSIRLLGGANFDLAYLALAKSLNVAPANLVEAIGPRAVARYAERFGLGSWKPVASSGLGTNEVTLLDLTDAYHPRRGRGGYGSGSTPRRASRGRRRESRFRCGRTS